MKDQIITLAREDDGNFDAYIARPKISKGPGVILLPEIFGLTDWMKKTAASFAARGFCTAAIEVFSRLEPHFVGDEHSPDDARRGLRYRGMLNHALAMEDIQTASEYLTSLPGCDGKVAAVGFCLGGTLAYLAAARLQLDAAVAYYGTQIHEFLAEADNIQCHLMLHLGTNDELVPVALQGDIRTALATNPNVTIYNYDAGHAFANSNRPEAYSPLATDIAHQRTFEFLTRLN